MKQKYSSSAVVNDPTNQRNWLFFVFDGKAAEQRCRWAMGPPVQRRRLLRGGTGNGCSGGFVWFAEVEAVAGPLWFRLGR
jgi:hypothetical protein